jgi:intergrase/recombinase
MLLRIFSNTGMKGPDMRYYAKGRTRQPKNGPNKTEQAYQDLLELAKRNGDILWYGFEKIKLRIAPKTFYTVDFFVLTSDGFLEAHEVKGHWEDDARVKIKVAAEMFPFRFIAVKPLGRNFRGWETEEF